MTTTLREPACQHANQCCAVLLRIVLGVAIVVTLPGVALAQSTVYSDVWDGDASDEDDYFDLYGIGVTETAYASGEIVWTESTLYDWQGNPVSYQVSEQSYTYARADTYRLVPHDEPGEAPANCELTCHWRMLESHPEHPWCEANTEAAAIYKKYQARYFYVGQDPVTSKHHYDADVCMHRCQLSSTTRSSYMGLFLHDPGRNVEIRGYGVCRHRFMGSAIRGLCVPPL